MRLTIIPSDTSVYVDGVAKMDLDLTACGVPSTVHAFQWYDTRGWLEFRDDADPFTPPPPNEIIEELPAWALCCVQVWENTPFPEEPSL